MKEKDQRGPGRPRKNEGSVPRYKKDSTPERRFGSERPEFPGRDTAPRYKKDRPDTEDRAFSPGKSAPRFSQDRDSGRSFRDDKGRFSSSKETPRFSKDRDSDRGFRGDKDRSSASKDAPRFGKDRDSDRGFRGDRDRSSASKDAPRFSKDRDSDGGFRGNRDRFPASKDAPRFGKDRDSDRGFRSDRDRSSAPKDAPRFNKDRDSDRGFRGDRDRSSASKDAPRFSKDRDSEFGTGRRNFSDENTASRYKREGDSRTERQSSPDTSRFKRESDFRPERRKFSDDGSRENQGSFKSFGRKKDEPFEYGKSSKPQRRPDYSEENLIKNIPEKQRKKIDFGEKKSAEQIRLNRYIANSGLCSRREADDLIESGQITVNGKTITEMGYQVKVTDVVKYGRKILNPEKLVYVLLNKPKDFITTTEDPEGRRTVMDLVAKAGPERIYPVGRLDRATTGLLLFTNDGELAEKLSHPSHEIRKIYQVEIDKPLNKEDFDRLAEGVELEDGFIKPDEVSVITPDQQVIGIEIHSGKNRVVRRIFEHLGYEVTQLDRTTYAGLTKKDLPRGNWRFLTEKEVIRLKYMI